MSDASYCLDSSGIIDWHERYYPPSAFPALVERLDELIAEGRLLISEEVWTEIEAKDAAARDWCLPRRERLVVATDADVAAQVRAVLRAHPRLVGALKNRSGADPFVIAVAQMKGAVVVTGESAGNEARPRIPYVCGQLGLPCISFLDLIKAEGWQF